MTELLERPGRPVRLDPFSNIVNVGWGGMFVVFAGAASTGGPDDHRFYNGATRLRIIAPDVGVGFDYSQGFNNAFSPAADVRDIIAFDGFGTTSNAPFFNVIGFFAFFNIGNLIKLFRDELLEVPLKLAFGISVNTTDEPDLSIASTVRSAVYSSGAFQQLTDNLAIVESPDNFSDVFSVDNMLSKFVPLPGEVQPINRSGGFEPPQPLVTELAGVVSDDGEGDVLFWEWDVLHRSEDPFPTPLFSTT